MVCPPLIEPLARADGLEELLLGLVPEALEPAPVLPEEVDEDDALPVISTCSPT